MTEPGRSNPSKEAGDPSTPGSSIQVDHSSRFLGFPSTCAIVDLSAIRSNLEGLRERVGRNRKVLVAVKADAYGHGAVRVSKLASEMGLDWLGVALVSEGADLRRAGISLPILKFSQVFDTEADEALSNDLSVTVCDFDTAGIVAASAARTGKTARVHVKIDTGMGRIGVHPDEAMELYRVLASSPGVEVEGLMTHFPVSDEAPLDFTRAQADGFRSLAEAIRTAAVSAGRRPPLIHAANSGAILAHPEAWFDMVRPGIMTYGTYPSGEVARSVALTEAMTFKTRVSFVKRVSAGTTISYGRTWAATTDRWIATIPVGYADGFNRLWTNRGRVIVNGVMRPIVGRVCMDQSMVDLGEACNAAPPARVGDHAVLFGRWGDASITQDDWARELSTITYEVTCRIDRRVPRVYVG